MPTYEYRCTQCGHAFEKYQRMSEEPGAECPQCKSPSERRLSGGAGFLFKGNGFYITDYRNDSYKKAADADKAGSSESKPTEKKSAPESKPGTSSE